MKTKNVQCKEDCIRSEENVIAILASTQEFPATQENAAGVGLKTLDPLHQAIVDKTIENVTRKLVGGLKNKDGRPPQGQKPGIKTDIKNTLDASSAKSVIEASGRGAAWKEMIEKSFSHGISSLSTLKFDGEFKVKNGEAFGLENVPNTPGVYVVFDSNNSPCYVGDAEKIRTRWYAGHLNENLQETRAGREYKLSKEFSEGCTVKFMKCNSKETAAAIEANLIKEGKLKGKLRVNSKEELLHEQGVRSNIEAKKMKDSSGSTMNLIGGAAVEGLKQSGWSVLEKLASECIKHLKDELVDIFMGGECSLIDRIKRFFARIWQTIVDVINKPMDILKGVFEFIVNAFSETIRKIYNLAKNIFDLGVAAWELYKGGNTMSKNELITKVTETIIVSVSLILWDALDAIIETELSGLIPPLAPFAPYLAATISAIGFGITSYYLSKFVPQIVDKILSFETGYHEAYREQSLACQQLITNTEMNLVLINDLKNYTTSSAELCKEAWKHAKKLSLKGELEIEHIDTLSDVNLILGIQ